MTRLRNTYVAALVATVTVAACTSSGTPTINISQAVSDATILVNGVASVESALASLPGSKISVTQQATIATDLAAAKSALAQLSALPTGSPANGTQLQTIETDINAVVSIAATAASSIPGVPPTVIDGLAAAQVLLPLIEVTVNELVPLSTPPVAVTAALVAPASDAPLVAMSPARARVVLTGATRT